MNPKKRSLRAFGLLMLSYAFLTFLYVLPIDAIFLLRRTTSVFYFAPAVFVFLYFSSKIIDRRVRQYLLAVSVLIIFWCVLRAGKYIAFEETESIARFNWYLYYIPILFIPQFSLEAAMAVGEPEEWKPPVFQTISEVISLICVVLVMTNDLHQRVFRFHPNFANWDADYFQEPLFWAIYLWDFILVLLTMAVLFRKCRLSANRRLIWIPIGYLCLGVVGLFLLNSGHLLRLWGKTIGEVPDMACYMLGGFWILCITIGLVPSNTGYGKLLQETSLATQITDMDYEVVYKSRSALPLTQQQMDTAGPSAIDENTLLYRKPVTGGYTYWQVDVTELERVNRELEMAKERMAEEAELIRQTNELKAKRIQIDAKSKVYDEIAVRVLPQSQKIALLSAETREHPENFARNMRLVSIYAAYIKRLSNMMLLASEGDIRKTELVLALSESARYLNKADIPAKVEGDKDEVLYKAETLITIYERFERLLEQALPTLEALHITLSCNVLKLTFEGAELTLPREWEGTAETDEGITFVRLRLGEEGEAV